MAGLDPELSFNPTWSVSLGIGFALITVYRFATILAYPAEFPLHAFLKQLLLAGRVVVGNADVLAPVPRCPSANRHSKFARQHLNLPLNAARSIAGHEFLYF